jgi:hypothetical protein
MKTEESDSFRKVANQLRRTPTTDAAAEEAQRKHSSWDFLLSHARHQERLCNGYQHLLHEAHSIISGFTRHYPVSESSHWIDLLRRVDLQLGVWGGGCRVPGRYLVLEHFEAGRNLETLFQVLADGWSLSDPPGEKFRDAFECGVGLIEHALRDRVFDGDVAERLNDPARLRADFERAFQAADGDALGDLTVDLCDGLATYRETLPAGFSVSFAAAKQHAIAACGGQIESKLPC